LDLVCEYIFNKNGYDEIKPESVGLVIPTEETCKRCHNEKGPSFKGFNFKEMFAKIEHAKPK